jgi:O-antigen/teichoic acid export membrane protein
MSVGPAHKSPQVTVPNNPPTILAASRTYFASRVLLIVSGLVSMPLLTRLLTKQEYGLLSLIFAIVSVLTIAGTLGFSEATLRFYAERQAQGPAAVRDLCDTMLGGSLTVCLLVATGTLLVARWLVDEPEYATILELTSVLVVIRVVSGVLLQIYRAQERSVAYATGRVVARYGAVAIAITLLLLFQRSALTVIVATIVAEGAVLAVVAWDLMRRGVLSRPRLIRPVVLAASAYGIPLAVAGSARFFLDYSDRFLIERFLGLTAVATYTVPYDLAQRFGELLFEPVGLAVMPIIFRRWVHDGRRETSQVASEILTKLIALVIPAGTLYLICSQDLIVLLASENYRDSASLTPFLLPGVLLSGINFIVSAGLAIQKDTIAIATNVCGAAILNVGLNLIVLPRWGLSGAAASTSIAFGALLAVNYLRSRSVLDLHLEFRPIANALVATGVMTLLLFAIGPTSSWRLVDLAVRGTAGATSATISFWILDPNFRRWVREAGSYKRIGADTDTRCP